MLAPFLVPALLLAAPAQPGWVNRLPEFPGRVYGLGVAPASNTRALATHQATDNAKADVLARLRANVKSDTQIKTVYNEEKGVTGGRLTEGASRSTNRRSDVQIEAQGRDIPGLTVEATYLDETGTAPTMYALAYLDVAIASQEVQSRFDAAAASYGADLGDDIRAKIHRTQVIKGTLKELSDLEDLFGLIRAGGADPGMGDKITALRLKAERERADLRRSLTFGMASNPDIPVDAEVRGAVRTTFLEEGLGWSDHNPDLTVTMRVRTGKNQLQTGRRWYDYSRNADFIIAQGTISLTLVDSQGQEYESTLVEAKGVGTSEFQADTLLLKDYKNKLTKTVGTWLANLGK